MAKIDISIIIGTLNRLNYLKKTIDRCLNSVGSKNLEIIINDAGSTDGTIEWLMELSSINNNIVVIFSETTTNVVEAYNKCFEMASGKYITWLSDDIYPIDNALEDMCFFMEGLNFKDMGAFVLNNDGKFIIPTIRGFLSPHVGCVYTETLKKYNYFNSDYPYYACDNEICARFLRMGGKILESKSMLMHNRVLDKLKEINSSGYNKLGGPDKFYLVHAKYGNVTNTLYPLLCFHIVDYISEEKLMKIYNIFKKHYVNLNYCFYKEKHCGNGFSNIKRINKNEFIKKEMDVIVVITKDHFEIKLPIEYNNCNFCNDLKSEYII